MEEWVKYKLGIFSHEEATEEMKIHVAKCLEVSKNFRALIKCSESVYFMFFGFLVKKGEISANSKFGV